MVAAEADDELVAGQERGVRSLSVPSACARQRRKEKGSLFFAATARKLTARVAASALCVLVPAQEYTGDIHNNVRHGVGTYEYANTFFRYEGEYVNGKKHGAPAPLLS